MFKKPIPPKSRPLSSRITRPCFSLCVDELVETENGAHEIRQVEKPRTPEQFRDLGDAECYGIAYLQTKGVKLTHVEGQSRVSPMEAINIAESAIDNLHIPQPTNEN
jgi:hypothetical protein